MRLFGWPVRLRPGEERCYAALPSPAMPPNILAHASTMCTFTPAGIGYGLYLTLSSWALFYVATHTDFFDGTVGMFSLQYQPVGTGSTVSVVQSATAWLGVHLGCTTASLCSRIMSGVFRTAAAPAARCLRAIGAPLRSMQRACWPRPLPCTMCHAFFLAPRARAAHLLSAGRAAAVVHRLPHPKEPRPHRQRLRSLLRPD